MSSGAVPLAVADRLHAFLRSQADAERDRMRFILWTALAVLVGLFIAWCRWQPKPTAVVAAALQPPSPPMADPPAPQPAAAAAPPPQQQQQQPTMPKKRSWVPANLPDLIAF